ncbi:DUF3149 domain-containing protein [Paucihalobacter sp.]|uniref:DUF3149 domain-containing protein n=1 Tax=Paucihalobacter sp. TaxID=2850405 RepID=UPI003D161BBF
MSLLNGSTPTSLGSLSTIIVTLLLMVFILCFFKYKTSSGSSLLSSFSPKIPIST